LIVSHTNRPPNKFVFCYSFLMVVFFFVVNTAQAQEKQDNHLDDSHGVIQNMGGHLMHVFKDTETVRDSTASKSIPVTVAKTEHNGSNTKPEEETLSFNFLFFIIQKFKVTDIID
jgi:hypothetical protein